MGRHAALKESTVSPPRSDLRALRDLDGWSSRTDGPATGVATGVTASAAPGNRPAVHGSPAGASRAEVNPDSAISAADLIERFRASGLLTNLTAKPAVRSADAVRPRPVAVRPAAGAPLRVADLRARDAQSVDRSRTTHRAGSHRASGSGPSSLPSASVLPALRPQPSIRVAVRPVLTVAAIITAVGLVEVPNLLTTTPSATTAHAVAAAVPVENPVTDPALLDAQRAANVSAHSRVATAPTPARPQRVSRSTRRTAASTRSAAAKPAAANHVPLLKPGQTVPGTWIRPSSGRYTSCFCSRWGSFHGGIDLASPLGTPILAVGDGIVIKAGPASGFGHWVVIQHANGDVSIYGHMKYFFVHVGQRVTAGEKIALVGDQGFSTGPHLHFEIHQGGFTGPKIDPIPWLKARGIVIGPRSADG